MKSIYLLCGLAPIGAFIAGLECQPNDTQTGNDSCKAVKVYQQYFNAAERLLDELDNRYDWVDAFDPQDYYDAAQSVRNLQSTKK